MAKTAKRYAKTIEKELKYYYQRFKKGMRVTLRLHPEAGAGWVESARVPGTLLIKWDNKDRLYLHNKTYIEKV
jgi:hypothetical protein